MSYEDIIYGVQDGIGRLTLNKPEKLNAMSWNTWAELESVWAEAQHDDATKVVGITGAGRGFAAGTDLTASLEAGNWHERPHPGRTGMLRSRHLGTEQLYNLQKPTIAAVNGVCVGAGLSLALACDIRVAAEAARFSAIFVKRAINADTGSSWFLPRLVGQEQASRMLFTGEMVAAEKALAIGLVSEVVRTEEVVERALELAGEIAQGPAVAIEIMKRMLRESASNELGRHIEMEEYLQGVAHQTEDVAEGRQSFLEKREPVFKGR
jgi:2-(1,2-epoxy-1,2-dihydrophenyl)acetyl-CoA isomerase